MSDFKRIEDKIDALHEKFDEMKMVQVGQAKDLEFHIKRTELAENRLEILEEDVIPLKNKYQQFLGAIKLLTFVAGGIGILYTILKIVEVLRP